MAKSVIAGTKLVSKDTIKKAQKPLATSKWTILLKKLYEVGMPLDYETPKQVIKFLHEVYHEHKANS